MVLCALSAESEGLDPFYGWYFVHNVRKVRVLILFTDCTLCIMCGTEVACAENVRN